MNILSSICIIALNIGYIAGNAVIGNGFVILGVNDEAHLNVPYVGGVLGLPPSDPATPSIGHIGLRNGDGDGVHIAGKFASTEPGCLCEGWGVAVPNLGIAAYANIASDRGVNNMRLVSFEGSDGDNEAKSVIVDTSGNIQVTHRFFPAKESDYAMRVDVTIKNIGNDTFRSTLYRRVMDWDVYPTPFSEYVTVIGTDADQLVFSNDNGFCSANPLAVCRERRAGTTNQDFKDSGPSDHGGCFDFDLGRLSPGRYARFKIFYGVAPGEKKAMQSLHDIGAEVASLGQQRNSPIKGLPYTFFFAFGNVGGKTIESPTVELCDCYSTTLVSESNDGRGSNCYSYEVTQDSSIARRAKCADDIDYIVLGRGNSFNRCGLRFIPPVITNRNPNKFNYDVISDVDGTGVRGIQVSFPNGIKRGKTFELCFDENQVSGTMNGGMIGYSRGNTTDYSCDVRSTLPNLCAGSMGEDVDNAEVAEVAEVAEENLLVVAGEGIFERFSMESTNVVVLLVVIMTVLVGFVCYYGYRRQGGKDEYQSLV